MASPQFSGPVSFLVPLAVRLAFVDFTLRLLGGDEVQTLVKFVNLPSPHPCPSPLGRGWPQAG